MCHCLTHTPWHGLFELALKGLLFTAQGLLAAQERDSSAQSHKAGDKAGSVEQEAAPDAQLFPAQRRRLYCYRAPSEGLLIQVRLMKTH